MDHSDLLLLLDRPGESLAFPKGFKKVLFKVPDNYLKPEYISLTRDSGELLNITKEVDVKEMVFQSLGKITDLSKEDDFSLFIPKHCEIAVALIKLFKEKELYEEFKSFAVYVREQVNPLLFNYAFSVALYQRKDTGNLKIPSLLLSFPHKFVDAKVFPRAIELSKLSELTGKCEWPPIVIPMDYTASNLEDEHRLAYFREDIGVNLHHWHWHLVYPTDDSNVKDRRGELFYYMHQQIIARYNFERLCNMMKRVEKFTNFLEPIPEAYFPKLNSHVAGRSFGSRVTNMRWKNVYREDGKFFADVDEMERWRDRIYDAIHLGYAINKDGQHISLLDNKGIDHLGNMVEASNLSLHSQYYGNLHNKGHIITSYIHDPDKRHLENGGVMGFNETAMRDPFFYRWHAFIDDIFLNYKNTLPCYTFEELNFENIKIEKVQIKTGTLCKENVFQTFWETSEFDIAGGLNYQPRKCHILVTCTYLQHEPFTYNITVNNGNETPVVGTCRIFMAPKFDERGCRWSFTAQKNMFIELDKFRVKLPPGETSIVRESSKSSVTIPYERMYGSLETDKPVEEDPTFNMCGCGWPANMLIPKGHQHFEAELFVMISDHKQDAVYPSDIGNTSDGWSYCGIKDKLYPDRRSMGYPFDRKPKRDVNTLADFLTPNMKVADVAIEFQNITKKREQKCQNMD